MDRCSYGHTSSNGTMFLWPYKVKWTNVLWPYKPKWNIVLMALQSQREQSYFGLTNSNGTMFLWLYKVTRNNVLMANVPIQFNLKNFNYPTRGTLVVVMAGS